MANSHRARGNGLAPKEAEEAQVRVDETLKAMRADRVSNGRGKAGKRRKKARDKKETERKQQVWQKRGRSSWDW